MTIPGWNAAEEFASSTRFKALKDEGIQVFEVTVTASKDAKPGLMNMHLLDATCSGHCNTDFRVFVVEK